MEKITTVQKLEGSVDSNITLAERYYAFLSVLNKMELAPREIQLLALTAVRGNITYGNVKSEFCERYNSTMATIGNMVSKLRKKRLLVKEKGIVRINPAISLNFDNNIILQINLKHNA